MDVPGFDMWHIVCRDGILIFRSSGERQMLKVIHCDQTLSIVCRPPSVVRKLFLKIIFPPSPNSKKITGMFHKMSSTKFHKRNATRAVDKKYFKWHLLNNWCKFNIVSQKCFS